MPAPKTALPVCPVEVTLALISDRWKVLILRDLMQDTRRFGELKRSVGHISQKVLTTNLRSMEQSGLINRHVYAEVPPRVGIQPDRFGPQPETCAGRHAHLGRRVPQYALLIDD